LADDEKAELQAQIERCRRLARFMLDDELRHSLEDLAAEFEAKLEKQPRVTTFLLHEGNNSSER